MSSAPSTSTTTKKITISTDGNTGGSGSKSSPTDKSFLIKVLQIALTFFYGQFFANAIYDNLMRGVPYVVENATAFPIIKVTLAGIIIALTIFAMISIWIKIWQLIFGSAIILILVSIFSLVISLIDLVQRRERNAINNKDFGADVAEIVVESLLRIAAVVLKFLMIKFLRSNYQRVPTSA